jgi:3-(3-hydroxy-phenyl)propionate hydroxylase
MLRENEDPRKMTDERIVWELLSRWVTPKEASLWRSAAYRFHAVIASRWRLDRVFLAGDAAHQQPPFLGQGMCQGIRDAVNLAWKLDLVIKGRAHEALLDSYALERREHVSRLIEIVKTLGRFVCERDEAKARARDRELIEEMGGEIRTTFRQDIMPRLSTGFFQEAPIEGRGELFPQPQLEDGRLFDDALGLGFRLIVAGDVAVPPQVLDANIPDLKVARFGRADALSGVGEAGVRRYIERGTILGKWISHHHACSLLVRPDNYVYGIAGCADEILPLIQECAEGLKTGGGGARSKVDSRVGAGA